MNLSQANLSKLGTKFRGYLKGSRLDAFFKTFGIKFAAGHWAAGEFADRFAPDGYNIDDAGFDASILAQMARVREAGVAGIEFHDAVFLDEKFRVVPAAIEEVKAACRRLGLVPTNMNTMLWSHPKWKLGSVCHANPAVRRAAMKICYQCIEVAKAVGCKSVALWPGADGWDYNFQVNYGTVLDRFIKACVKINKAAKKAGLRFGTEAKLKEPREGNIVVCDTSKALLVASTVNRACGGRNMGVCVDYGHVQMCGNEPADMVYTAKQVGVPLVNFHINNAKYRSNDEDRVTGTGDNWRLADFCYAAIDTGYDGWFGEDQFTYRMDQVAAISLSRELFGNVMKKALLIYRDRDRLLATQAKGDAASTIGVVKEVLT